MTPPLRDSVHMSLGEPAACRPGPATCSRSPFAREVFDTLWDLRLRRAGERDHSGRFGWHVAAET
jgi:hypothetical protein